VSKDFNFACSVHMNIYIHTLSYVIFRIKKGHYLLINILLTNLTMDDPEICYWIVTEKSKYENFLFIVTEINYQTAGIMFKINLGFVTTQSRL
jgi:hypothetical protein